MWVFPEQKVSKKVKETEDWKGRNIEFFTSQTLFYRSERLNYISQYRAASGVLDASTYKYVLNPYNSPGENLRKYPAQMTNKDIISPIVNSFLGEKADKPNNALVVCTNPDSVNEFEKYLNEQFSKVLAQDFINQLNEAGQETGLPSKEIPDYETLVDLAKLSWKDKRAIFGQEALDFLRYKLDLKDKYQTAFYDWVVTHRVYTYKDIYKDDVDLEIVSPVELWHGTSASNFLEDAGWATRHVRWNAADVLDRLKEYLDEELVEYVEGMMRYDNSVTTSTISQIVNIDVRNGNRDTIAPVEMGLIDVFHCTWKSFKKYGLLKYFSDLGTIEELEVDEDYKIDKDKGDIEIEWVWGTEVWEGWKIGDKILYKSVRPILCQRSELNDISITKLPYNGRINKRPSVVQTLMAYQALYNIYHFRAELTLARNKDKLMLMPKGLLPEGWEPDKALYFAETTGIMWFDETRPNAAATLSAIRGVDMSLGAYVKDMRDLLYAIKEEAWEAVGMNRQRYGNINSSDGKATTEQALFKSATITRELFRQFERFEEKEYEGLLDFSKVAWANGKQGMYVNSDGQVALMKVNPDEHINTSYGVFVKDNAEELEKSTAAKQAAMMMSQKGAMKGSTILEIIDTKNFSKLKGIVRTAEAIEEQLKQAEVQAQQQHEQNLIAAKNAELQNIQVGKEKIEQIKGEYMLKAAQMKTHSDLAIADSQVPEPEPDPLEEYIKYTDNLLSNIRKQASEKDKVSLQGAKNSSDARLKERELDIKNKDVENKKEIAVINKNKYDKK